MINFWATIASSPGPHLKNREDRHVTHHLQEDTPSR
jgi:hypothetical protein